MILLKACFAYIMRGVYVTYICVIMQDIPDFCVSKFPNLCVTGHVEPRARINKKAQQRFKHTNLADQRVELLDTFVSIF